jgi:hypothetical protein
MWLAREIRRRWLDRPGGTIAAAVLLVAASSAAPPATQQPVLSVEVDDASAVTLVARRVSLNEALEAIGKQVGFEVEVHEGSGAQPLDLSIDAATVESALRQLLRGTSYALFYEADDGSVSRVVVLSPTVRPTPRPTRAQVRSRAQRRLRR